jgi:hypothetical protein
MVELYFEKELSDIVFEAESLEEWKSLAEELGISDRISQRDQKPYTVSLHEQQNEDCL